MGATSSVLTPCWETPISAFCYMAMNTAEDGINPFRAQVSHVVNNAVTLFIASVEKWLYGPQKRLVSHLFAESLC